MKENIMGKPLFIREVKIKCPFCGEGDTKILYGGQIWECLCGFKCDIKVIGRRILFEWNPPDSIQIKSVPALAY
jgi:hypothetical protein